MPLPKIEHPVFEVYLKSLDKKVKFRPFLVKEEKLLLMAKESDDVEEIAKTIKQVIRNCMLETVDVDALPTFDVEMFFIHLRIHSIAESAEMVYNCNHVVDEAECGNQINFMLDLRNVRYVESDQHTNIVKLSDTTGMRLSYPTLSFSEQKLLEEFEDGGYSFIAQYLDYIYDSQQIYKKSDISEDELKEFIDNLTMDQVKAIRDFFSTSPKVALNQELTCPKCNYVHTLNVEGLLNFFD